MKKIILIIALSITQITHAMEPIKEASSKPSSTADLDLGLVRAAQAGNVDNARLFIANGANVNAQFASGGNASALRQAAQNGHPDMVKLLLANGAIVDIADMNGMTPLMIAAAAGHLPVVKLLLRHKANVNTRAAAAGNTSALLQAAQNGNEEMVKLLLASGAKVDIADINGMTPLLIAAENGHLPVVKLLLKHKANVNAQFASAGNASALRQAAQNGNEEMVKLLLANGAMVDIADINGITPLLIAAENGHLPVVKLLLKHKANINTRAAGAANASPLRQAAMNGHESVVKFLLAKGALVDIADTEGITPLLIAAENGHLPVVKLFLKHKANINARAAGANNASALRLAAIKGHEDVVQLLLKNGMTLDATDQLFFLPPLMMAIQTGDLIEVKKLLDEGALVNMKTHRGYTPAMEAAKTGKIDILRLLLERGADLNEQDAEGYTALDHAIINNSEAAEELIRNAKKYKIDLDHRDALGQTPLMVAINKNKPHLAFFLLEHGANPNIQETISGATALHCVLDNEIVLGTESERLINELIAHGANVNQAEKLYSNTPLHLAYYYDYQDIANLLIKLGANESAENIFKTTPRDIKEQMAQESEDIEDEAAEEDIRKLDIQHDIFEFIVFLDTNEYMHSSPGAITLEFLQAIHQQIPIIINQEILASAIKHKDHPLCNLSKEYFEWLDANWTIYRTESVVQDSQQFFVFIPKNFVFEQSLLDKNNKITRIVITEFLKGNFERFGIGYNLEIFKSIFETDELQSIPKVILLDGHGSLKDTTNPPMIASLTFSEYRDLLMYFNTIRCSFLGVISCFGGGLNRLEFHQHNLNAQTKKLTLEYPIIIGSLTDMPATVKKENFSQYFKRISLFWNRESFCKAGIKMNVGDQPLWQVPGRWLQWIAQSIWSGPLKNFPSVLLPGIQTIFKPLALSDSVAIITYPVLLAHELEYETQLRKPQVGVTPKRLRHQRMPFVFDNKEAILIYPTTIQVPFEIRGKKFPRIVSMIPGNAHHFINEINTPTFDLEDLITQGISGIDIHNEKAFLVRTYIDKHKKSYTRLLIVYKPVGPNKFITTAIYSKEGIYKKIIYEHSVDYSLGSTIVLPIQKISESEITHHDALKEMRDILLETIPAKGAVFEATGGIETEGRSRRLINKMFGKID